MDKLSHAVQERLGREEILEERLRLARLYFFLPLGLDECVGRFSNDRLGRDEFMDVFVVVLTQPARMRRMRAGNLPADSH
jgi:hypothetical protein